MHAGDKINTNKKTNQQGMPLLSIDNCSKVKHFKKLQLQNKALAMCEHKVLIYFIQFPVVFHHSNSIL